jgi:hypothetical protein
VSIWAPLRGVNRDEVFIAALKRCATRILCSLRGGRRIVGFGGTAEAVPFHGARELSNRDFFRLPEGIPFHESCELRPVWIDGLGFSWTQCGRLRADRSVRATRDLSGRQKL